jgi:glycosyltransferase involved in cell wall biosynthesis
MLEKLFESIAAQNFDFNLLEIVISDNSTTDLILKVAKQWDNKLPIKYVLNHETFGVSNNTNNAIEHATYGLIKPMYMDDIFLTDDALGLFAGYLKLNKWVMASSRIIDAKGNLKHHVRPRCMFESDLRYNHIGMPSVIGFHKCDVRFDPNLKSHLDTWFYYCLFREYGTAAHIDKHVIGQRLWDGSISSNQKHHHHEDLSYLRESGQLPFKELQPLC